jgi:N-methylhydantoinase A
MLWVGIDVGGTFTDGVVYDDTAGRFRFAKAASTPEAPTRGVMAVLDLLDCDPADIARFCHGVTIGTNAILERKGADVWMLTTGGFRDVLEIGRTNRPVLYDLRTLKPRPLVPRARTLEVEERLMWDGSVRHPLAPAQVRAVVGQIPSGGDPAVAVCLLHSYANPAHEQAVKQIVQTLRPELFVCTSEEVSPQFREVERFNTAVLNAYIGPLMARYLDDLTGALSARGYAHGVFITTSNGGVATAGRARHLPVATVLSGPAGGVAAAVHLGRLRGEANLITCDMGGTSTDVCLIEQLRIPVTHEQRIGDHANRTAQIEINAVGAGGGSIAWLDDGDILMVGPQSAGASPGPACYGRGGEQPTVTDANLVLGRLAAGSPLAGRIGLDRDLALAAVGRLGKRIGLETEPLAAGIVRIAVGRMVSAIKQISIANGYDPRDFTLLPYGGAGPMHAAAIADELEMTRVLIPVGPGNFAAFGSLISDLRRDYARTRTTVLSTDGAAAVETLFRDIEAQAHADLLSEGVAADRIALHRAAGMRYVGQSWELHVELPATEASVAAMQAAFAEVHDRRFGHRSQGAVEIVTYRVAAVGRVDKPELPAWTSGGPVRDATIETRPVWIEDRFIATPILDRARLAAGQTLPGPAILEESGSTTWVPPGWSLQVLEYGDLLMEKQS